MLRDAPISATIPVANLNRAKKFYGEKLGLTTQNEMDEGVIYECGDGTTVFVYQSDGAGTSKATSALWEVEDLDAEMAWLRQQGVVFEDYDQPGLKTENGVMTSGSSKAAWFKDSEGNILSLWQPGA